MARKSLKPVAPKLEHVLKLLRERLPELHTRYGVLSLGVFGSYIRNEERKNSDLDLLVEFGLNDISMFEFVRLEQELNELLGLKVDLVEKDSLKPEIGKRILKEVRPI